MLLARPAGLGSWSFIVSDGPEDVARAQVPTVFSGGGLLVRGVPFGFEAETRKRLRMAFQGVEVGAAERSGWPWFRYAVRIAGEVTDDGQPLDLTLRSGLGRSVRVDVGGERIGRIRRLGWFRRETEVDLPEELPLAVQTFLLAVVLVEWRREARRRAS